MAKRDSKPGRTWQEVVDPAEIGRIMADRAEGMTFSKIEEKYGLRQNNGMSAYNVVKKRGGPQPVKQAPVVKQAPKPVAEVKPTPESEPKAEASATPEASPAEPVESMTDKRRKVADQAFETATLPAEVKAMDGWMFDGHAASRVVYYENATGPSVRGSFTVEFKDGTADVDEVWHE